MHHLRTGDRKSRNDGTVERWNDGTVEWWNGGMAENDPKS